MLRNKQDFFCYRYAVKKEVHILKVLHLNISLGLLGMDIASTSLQDPLNVYFLPNYSLPFICTEYRQSIYHCLLEGCSVKLR